MACKTLCRLCGRNVKEYINMFSDEGMKRRLDIKTVTCLQIPVSICDSLPTIICPRCCKRLDDSYDFFERASKVQVFLENIYHPISELHIKEDPATPKTESSNVAKYPQKSNKKKKDIPLKPRRSELLQGYPWTCVLCDSGAMDSLEDLCQHYSTAHGRSAIFKCIHCGKQYDRYRSFTKHLGLHQNSTKFQCETCDKVFTLKSSLIAHALVHTDERPYPCEICDKTFKSSSTLVAHSKLHLPLDKRPIFSCEPCNKTFTTKRALECHVKIHNDERDFMCDICGKSFVSKGSLTSHLAIHTQERNYRCGICNGRFSTERTFRKHISLHSSLKPFQCEVCDKVFREKGTLTAHLRVHTGEMPYSCETCGKKFRFASTLKVHKRQHTGEKPYTCTFCQKKFTNAANYGKHIKRMHLTPSDEKPQIFSITETNELETT